MVKRKRAWQECAAEPSQEWDRSNDFRSRADPFVSNYLVEVDEHLRGVAGADERALLVSNVAQEVLGVESKVAVDATCSRIVEGMMPEMGTEQLLKFLDGVLEADALWSIASNPYGSHFLETMLHNLSSRLKTSGHNMDNAVEVLQLIVKHLKAHLYEYLMDRYATHLVRSMLVLLSGRDVTVRSKASQAHGQKDREHRIGALEAKLVTKQDTNHDEPVYKELLQQLLATLTTADYGGDCMVVLRSSPYAGPVLQGFLRAASWDRELLCDLIWSVLGFDGVPDNSQLLSAKSIIHGIMERKESSHLVETVFSVAPEEVLSALFSHVLNGSLLELSRHPCANFVVQSAAASARLPDQVAMLVAELGPHFGTLLMEQRAGVVLSVLASCQRRQVAQFEASNFLADGLQSVKADKKSAMGGICAQLLTLNNGVKLGEEGKGRLSPLGCIVLTTVLSFPKNAQRPFISSIVSFSREVHRHMARDAGGARVLEAFMEGSSKKKSKRLVMGHLEGLWAQMAEKASASHLVEKCFDRMNIHGKEKILSEVVARKAEVSATPWGCGLLNHCRAGLYERNRDKWKEWVKKGGREIQNFLATLGLDDGMKHSSKQVKNQVKGYVQGGTVRKERKGPRVEEMETGMDENEAGDAEKRNANNPGAEEGPTVHLQQKVPDLMLAPEVTAQSRLEDPPGGESDKDIDALFARLPKRRRVKHVKKLAAKNKK
ncbi:unnamed protein product [Ostreobium quekettii]|uniref:Nucleolar protein 9 n=1 Tax=Ostreobium quekettii TaxID=121088 RepID=A0A8S1J969_9CHLO|nr:unnamed protein product [Ostreobium quekettii]